MAHVTSEVVSADGTSISFRTYGNGPGVVLIHGGGGAAQGFDRLATALSSGLTVHVPDRRGRGRSGPFGPHHGLASECADLDALLRHTGARGVFGLSSGAVIALHAASRLPAIEKLAVYEPPLFVDGAVPDAWAPRFERELARGDLGAAIVTVLRGTGDAGSLFTRVPRFLLAPLLGFGLRREKPAPGRIAFRDLLPTLRQDLQLVHEAAPLVGSFAELRCDVLLLGGERSPRELRAGIDALARMLPLARRTMLPGVGHTAALDEGKPELVAGPLRAFFAPPG